MPNAENSNPDPRLAVAPERVHDFFRGMDASRSADDCEAAWRCLNVTLPGAPASEREVFDPRTGQVGWRIVPAAAAIRKGEKAT